MPAMALLLAKRGSAGSGGAVRMQHHLAFDTSVGDQALAPSLHYFSMCWVDGKFG